MAHIPTLAWHNGDGDRRRASSAAENRLPIQQIQERGMTVQGTDRQGFAFTETTELDVAGVSSA